MSHDRKILWRGRMMWKPEQLRVWSHSGETFYLGRHTLEKTRKIADELGYALIVGGELDEVRASARTCRTL